MTVLKRQFITDTTGKPIGVILPFEEFALIAELLEQRLQQEAHEMKLRQMELAVQDPQFLADLTETMTAFHTIDTEGWESAP